MKNWFTLLLITLIAAAGFSQQSLSPKLKAVKPVKMKVDPRYPVPVKNHISNPVTRSVASACDTEDMLDFNTYSEVGYANIGVNGQILDFQGSWNATQPQPYGTEITSDIDANHEYLLAYGGSAFDTLAFQDYTNDVLFGYPQASSTVYLDSLAVFLGIYGDTTAGGLMANDSLLFSIYPIDNHIISSTPDTVVVLSGYAGLEPFFTGAGYLGYHQIGVNQQFNQGEGFFVKLTYIAKDTSSHCTISYTFPDSCGITDDAAYPPNLVTSEYLHNTQDIGSTFFGQIQTSGTTTSVYDGSNANSTYGITGAPANCTYVFYQNFEILPIVNICVNYGGQITATPAGGCPGVDIGLTAAVWGTPAAQTDYVPNEIWSGNLMNYINANNANITYTWASSPGTLTSNGNQNNSFTMPASGNDTVGLTLFDGTNSADIALVVKNNAITLGITNPQPVQFACGGSVTVTASLHGSTVGPVYTWGGVNLDTITNSSPKLSIIYPGTYTISAHNAAGCTAFDTFQVAYSNGATNNVNFTAPSPICENFPATFTNTSTGQTNWTEAWTFGDPIGGTSTLLDPTYTYTGGGRYTVELVMDSAGCLFQSPAQSVIVYTPQNNNACVAGIQDISFDNSISLLPNPSNGNVNMIINGIQGNVLIRVYNILGSEVYNYQANELPSVFNKSFDFGNLANGTYLVKIQSGNETAVKRLVITK